MTSQAGRCTVGDGVTVKAIVKVWMGRGGVEAMEDEGKLSIAIFALCA